MQPSDIQDHLVKLSDLCDAKGISALASKIDAVIENRGMLKIAQYVGVIGYVLKQHRGWCNCLRRKRSEASDRSMQEITMECLKEYQDGQKFYDEEWHSKYAELTNCIQKMAEANPEAAESAPLVLAKAVAEENNISEHLVAVEEITQALAEYQEDHNYITKIASVARELIEGRAVSSDPFDTAPLVGLGSKTAQTEPPQAGLLGRMFPRRELRKDMSYLYNSLFGARRILSNVARGDLDPDVIRQRLTSIRRNIQLSAEQVDRIVANPVFDRADLHLQKMIQNLNQLVDNTAVYLQQAETDPSYESLTGLSGIIDKALAVVSQIDAGTKQTGATPARPIEGPRVEPAQEPEQIAPGTAASSLDDILTRGLRALQKTQAGRLDPAVLNVMKDILQKKLAEMGNEQGIQPSTMNDILSALFGRSTQASAEVDIKTATNEFDFLVKMADTLDKISPDLACLIDTYLKQLSETEDQPEYEPAATSTPVEI